MTSGEQPPEHGAFPILGPAVRRRPLTARRAAGVISIVTIVLTVAGGVLIWLVDRDNFSSLGEGMWWAVQTLTTVGYGDVVPSSTSGRVIATIIMLNGIAFLTVITASVTATLVEQIRRHRPGAEESDAPDADVAARLEEIGARLDSIETALARRERREHE
jgi:voltage-gated potassium channel